MTIGKDGAGDHAMTADGDAALDFGLNVFVTQMQQSYVSRGASDAAE